MILPTNDERDIMARKIFVLSTTNVDSATEILGSYSESEFAQNAAQIYINDVNDNYGCERIELDWSGGTATSRDAENPELFIQFNIDTTSLDEDVRL